MKSILNLSKKSFAIYGLGTTGRSVIKYFNKVNFKNYTIWDDNKIIKKYWHSNKQKKERFQKSLDFVDYIIVSPGINLKKAKLKKFLFKNKSKIITDLDLFYILNPKIKSIVVTGTNGKSTTCKIIDHVLKKNKIKTSFGGNIGRPILNLNLKNNSFVVIEASSFQLAYSKFIKPNFALMLNISNDHLDWHGSMTNYLKSKLRIFRLQNKNDFAFINSKSVLNKFKENQYSGKLIFVNLKDFKTLKSKINNNYLNSIANEENMSFVLALSKLLKISQKSFIGSLKSFKGLPHRHEIFLKKNNKIFINDSKATSFEATKFALKSNNNIFWIVGGMPKKGDKFRLTNFKKNIIKYYIIGNNIKKFKSQLNGKVDFKLSKTLNNAIVSIFRDIKKLQDKKITILLSPASASYDQYKNFEERGNQFKKLIKIYARKYL